MLFLYARDRFWNEALFNRVTGFTFNMELMELNIMTILRVYLQGMLDHFMDGEDLELTHRSLAYTFSFQYFCSIKGQI